MNRRVGIIRSWEPSSDRKWAGAAGAEGRLGQPEDTQERDEQVRKRLLGLEPDVAAGGDLLPTAARHQDRQIRVKMAVPVRDAAAERTTELSSKVPSGSAIAFIFFRNLANTDTAQASNFVRLASLTALPPWCEVPW